MRTLFRQELTEILRSGSAFAAMGLALLTLLYAGWSGDQRRDQYQLGLDRFVAASQIELSNWLAELSAVEANSPDASPFSANPMGITFPAVLPAGPLHDFAAGHADLQPVSAEVTLWRNLADVFGRYQFDSPELLAAGSFDVALVLVLFIPLLMIALSYDALARERDQGTLVIVLSAPLSLSKLLWTKLVFRNGMLWIWTLLILTFLAVVNDAGGDRFARFSGWLMISLAYGCFWLALIAWVLSQALDATRAAAILVACWFLLTLAIPGLVSTSSEALFPTPSRLALLSEIRQVEAETNLELAALTDQYLNDHPELTVGDEGMPSFYRATYLTNDRARQRTAPLLERFEAAQTARAELLRWAQLLSPSIVAQRAFHGLADANLERFRKFQAQVRAALFQLSDEVGPAVVSRNRISSAAFRSLEPFRFRPTANTDLYQQSALAALYLLALAAILAALAQRRLADETSWT